MELNPDPVFAQIVNEALKDDKIRPCKVQLKPLTSDVLDYYLEKRVSGVFDRAGVTFSSAADFNVDFKFLVPD